MRQIIFPIALIIIVLALLFWLYVASGSASESRPSEPSTPTAFTNFPGREVNPSFSPDGNKVAFAWRDEEGETYDLFIKTRGEDTPLHLTHHAGLDAYPTWSPDGTTVAFVRATGTWQGIFIVPANGGSARQLLETASWVRGLHWSPDGQFIVFAEQSEQGAPYRLFRLALTTLERTPLTAPPASYAGDFYPMFSPDSKKVAFVRGDAHNNQDVYVVSFEGGEPERLTTNQRHVQGLSWRNDHTLIFSSDRGGAYDLWKVSMGDKQTAWLGIRGQWMTDPTVANGVPALVYQTLRIEENIWRISLDGLLKKDTLITSKYRDGTATYAPAGTQIAFISSRSGTPELWISDATGTNLTQQTHFNGPWVGRPQWSPDGRHLAFNANPEGEAVLYLMETDGVVPHRITKTGWNAPLSSWSRDGEWIYFGSDQSGSWEIWKINPEEKTPIQVTQNGGFRAIESTDGQTLFFAKSDQSGIWERPATGGAETLILADVRAEDWDVTKAGLYFIDRTKEVPALSFYDFDTQNTRHVVPLQKASLGLAISPDESFILYSRIEKSESDLMWVEGFR